MKIMAALALVLAIAVVIWMLAKGPVDIATSERSSEPEPECQVLQRQLADSKTALESDFIRNIGWEKGCWSKDGK